MDRKYLIFLSGGQIITGVITADMAALLLVEFRKRFRKKHYCLVDADGPVDIDMRKVVAIGINKLDTEKSEF